MANIFTSGKFKLTTDERSFPVLGVYLPINDIYAKKDWT